MRNNLVLDAMKNVENPQVLINMVSKRVRQLGLGDRPMIEVVPKMTFMDVALKEIADGKLSYEAIVDEPVETAPSRKKRASS